MAIQNGFSLFSQERALMIREILDNYYFDKGIAITKDRYFITHRSKRLKQLHFKVGCLAVAYVPPEQEKDHMRELKRIRDALKIEYGILKLKGAIKNGIERFA